MIKINNIQKSYSYPLIQLRGCVHNSIKSEQIFIRMNSETNSWPLIDNKFKIYIHLTQHLNKTIVWIENQFNKRISELNVDLIYEKCLNNRFIKLVYLVCDDSEGNLFENGFFQSPESEDNSIDSALERIGLNASMIQCFFAQTLPNQKTFHLELNPNNCPKVHIFRLKSSVEQIWSLSSNQLWELVAKQLMSSVLADNNVKFIAFCAFTRFLPNSSPIDSTKFSNILLNVRGYSSLGGGGLALLSTACLYTWARHPLDIINRFNDESLVDRNHLMDDSFNRGSLWGCYSTTLGAIVHELGHILDLGHSISGIMGSDFHYIKSFFVMESNQSEAIKWWNSSEISILWNHKWINCYKVSEEQNPFKIVNNLMKSKFGIISIEYRDSGNERTVKSRVFTLAAKLVRLEQIDGTLVFAIDSKGNTIKHNLEKL